MNQSLAAGVDTERAGERAARVRARGIHMVAGAAVASSSPALSSVLQGWQWLWVTLITVGLMVLVGLLLRARPRPWAAVMAAQLAALLVLITVLFGRDALLGVLPGPATLGDLADQLGSLGEQIHSGIPPLPTNGPLLLLVCLVYGVLAILVDAMTAIGFGPAACGLALLCAYTVSTTLARDALPNWTLATGAAGFAVLLVVDQRRRQAYRNLDPSVPEQSGENKPENRSGRARAALARHSGIPVGLAVTACALAVALLVGILAAGVGTEGRFSGNSQAQGEPDLQFGLNPFTSIRGQLTRPEPVDLLRVRGLPNATYLRALTLSEYVPSQGWQLPRRRGNIILDRTLPTGLPSPPAVPVATVDIENIGYKDRWLPLAGLPLGVTGVVPGRWLYDVSTATAYTSEAVTEPRWVERAALVSPRADALDAAPSTTDVDPAYLNTAGVDPRIVSLSARVTAGVRSPFAKAAALNRFFLDPANGFRYSLTSPPGNTGDALVDFLERGKVGYCEQFASAMGVMLRTVGVPARVAVGFTPGKDDAGVRTVGTPDAHAWVEAYFPGYGWLTFDPTPLGDGRAVTPGYLSPPPNLPPVAPPSEEISPPAGQDQASPPPLGGSPPPSGSDAGAPDGGAQPEARGPDPDSGGSPDDGAADRDGRTDTTMAVLLGLLIAFGVLALVAAPSTARRIARHRRQVLAGRGGPLGAAAAWREVLAESLDRGGPPPDNSTVRATARQLVLGHRIDATSSHAVRAVVDAVERGWYAPPTKYASGDELLESLREATAGLGRAAPLSFTDRLWPRSVRPRLRRRDGATAGVVDWNAAKGSAGRHSRPNSQRDDRVREPAG